MDKSTVKADEKAFKRSYSPKTLKVLFGFCGNRCAEPNCLNSIVNDSTQFSAEAVVGQIAHIYAVANNGPRGKPGLTNKERNAPDNLILLCPTHHTVVDAQYETYPATLLLDWKAKQERPYRQQLQDRINDLGYKELGFAAESLLSTDTNDPTDYVVVPPAAKITKNELGKESANLLRMGAAKSRECQEVLTKASQLQPDFAERLRQGFVTKYNDLRDEGLSGDDLFMGMYDWAGGMGKNKIREASGLCILSHLFVTCDVFEK